MLLIIVTVIVIYFICMAWTWQSLGFIEKTKKVIIILIEIIIMYGITQIIFQTTKNGIIYPNEEIKNSVQNILVAIFTGINGIIIMPQIGKILDKINEDEMKKEILVKRLIILVVIFIICLILEKGYMTDTQEGILTWRK